MLIWRYGEHHYHRVYFPLTNNKNTQEDSNNIRESSFWKIFATLVGDGIGVLMIEVLLRLRKVRESQEVVEIEFMLRKVSLFQAD